MAFGPLLPLIGSDNTLLNFVSCNIGSGFCSKQTSSICQKSQGAPDPPVIRNRTCKLACRPAAGSVYDRTKICPGPPAPLKVSRATHEPTSLKYSTTRFSPPSGSSLNASEPRRIHMLRSVNVISDASIAADVTFTTPPLTNKELVGDDDVALLMPANPLV